MSFIGRNNAKITNRPSGGGSKLQGLTSTTNKKTDTIRAIKERAWGENRNIVFCMNQLGGVGRHKSQFHTPADGLNCKEGEEEDYTQLYISQIQNFLNNAINNKIVDLGLENFNKAEDFQLSFVGDEEHFWNDINNCTQNEDISCNTKETIPMNLQNKIFGHLKGNSQITIYLIKNQTTYDTNPITIDILPNILEKINYVNSKIPEWVNESNLRLGMHTLGILNNNFVFGQDRPKTLLPSDGYGINLFGLIAYASTNTCTSALLKLCRGASAMVEEAGSAAAAAEAVDKLNKFGHGKTHTQSFGSGPTMLIKWRAGATWTSFWDAWCEQNCKLFFY